MRIKILDTSTISKTNGDILNVVDIELIEGDTFLRNTKYKSEDSSIKFTLLYIGHYNPSIVKKYPCVIEISNGIDLKILKDKIFVVE